MGGRKISLGYVSVNQIVYKENFAVCVGMFYLEFGSFLDYGSE